MATNRFRWLKAARLGWLGRPTLAVGQMANMGPAAWREYKGDPAVFYGPSVGPALDTGVYILHAITGLLGPARRVEAFGGVSIPRRNVLIPGRAGQVVDVTAPDHLLIHLDFGDNRFAQVLSSFATPRSKAPALEIHGEMGTVSMSLENWYEPDAPVDVWLRESAQWQGALEGSHPARLFPNIALDPGRAGALRRGPGRRGSPDLTAEHATHVLEIILAAGVSMEEGCAVELSQET